MPIGNQDPWITGCRVEVKRRPIDGVQQPIVDFGVMQVINPQTTNDTKELFDSRSGSRVLFDTANASTKEEYDGTFYDLVHEKLAYIFQGNPPEEYGQAATVKSVLHHAHPGRLLAIHDNDDDTTLLYGLGAISGIHTGVVATNALTAIVKSTKTITLTGDLTAEAGLAAGKSFIVAPTGLSNILNARSYVVVSKSLVSMNTAVVVEEEPAANETAITGSATYEDGGTIYEQGVDWEVVDLTRGVVRMLEDGAFAAAADVTVQFSTADLEGPRVFYPQQIMGDVTADIRIFYPRKGGEDITVRECIAKIRPGATAFNDQDYSTYVLHFSVVVDPTAQFPAGRMLHIKGDLPALS